MDARSQRCKLNIATVDLMRQTDDVLCQKDAWGAMFCELVTGAVYPFDVSPRQTVSILGSYYCRSLAELDKSRLQTLSGMAAYVVSIDGPCQLDSGNTSNEAFQKDSPG